MSKRNHDPDKFRQFDTDHNLDNMFISLDEILNKDFNKGTLISRLLEKPKKLLATILVANNFVNIAVVILFSSFSGRLFNGIETYVLRFALEVVLVTFFLLLFGEVLPKIYANRNNIVFAQKVAVSISLLNVFNYFYQMGFINIQTHCINLIPIY